ncbi:MAG: alkaline phosphatase family protein [Candidatus Krumholzibacteriota bacterium]|nr:alkaline phosphatase family protein [Candidatus Krumholzibacteriota bacterium]
MLRTIIRYAAAGLAAGFVATAITLVVLPHFYSHVTELLVFPAAAAVAALPIGAVAAVVRRSRKKASPSRAAVFGRSFGAVLTLSVLLSLGLYALRAPARAWKVAPKLVVMCIDGATWDLINPFIDAGLLPNLARLKKGGTSAVLRSTDPAFSLIAWTTIGAGVEPDKHGITSFYHTQDDLKSKRIWEVFEDYGHSIGVFRWWITWPPRVRNGFVIPDILARDGASFPPRYNFINQFRMERKSGHSATLTERAGVGWKFLRSGVRLETCMKIAREYLPAAWTGVYADVHIATKRAEIRLNADVYGHLLRRIEPEYTCFYDNGADQMCHFYWQFFEPEKFEGVDPEQAARYGTAIPDYYRLHDQIIGDILDHIGPSATIAVISDHGFRADNEGTQNWYFARGGPILAALEMDTEYYSIALGSVTFVESVRQDPAEKRAALERAALVLNSLRVVESEVPLFNAYIEQEARLQLDVSDSLQTLDGHVETSSGTVALEEWFNTRVFAGTHDPAGVFIGYGGAFRPGHEGTEAKLVDIAPTILHTSGFPLSRELDGSVMWDWITTLYRDSNEVVWVDTYGHYDPLRRDIKLDAETLKRLRSLGYVR